MLARLALALALAARPAAAQDMPAVFSTYTGCNLYFCTLVRRMDVVMIPDYDYRFVADLFFTLRAPIIDAAPTAVVGSVLIDLGADPDADYEGGIGFFFDPTGHQAGDVLQWTGSGGGHKPAGAFTLVAADLWADTPAPGQQYPFSDHVENALVLTTPEPATFALLAGGLAALGAAGALGLIRARPRRTRAAGRSTAPRRPSPGAPTTGP
jgi:hypothetical protein